MSRFWNFIKNEATETTPESIELRINGDIIPDDDAWIYEWFDIPSSSPNAFREQLKEYTGKDITVWIDSCGGDVFAAAGIYNALKEHSQNGGKVTVKIDGKAMSAASVIAMAGDEILMSPVAIMMIHNPLSAVQGYASDMRKQADVLDEVKESIINAYASKTGKSRNKISALMDDEKYMSATTAVKLGFADDILYRNKKDSDAKESNEVMNFNFNRLAILNCENKSLQKLLNFKKNIDNLNEEKKQNDEIYDELEQINIFLALNK